MGRAADDAVRAFEGGGVGADGERKARLQEDAPLVPVDVGLEFEAGRVGPEAAGLHDRAVAEAAGDADGGAVRAASRRPRPRDGGDLLALARVVVLDVPGVPVARLVDIGPDLVAATGQRLAAGALVEDAGERAVGAISTRRSCVLERVSRRRRAAARRRPSRTTAAERPGIGRRAGEHAAALDRLAAGQRVGRDEPERAGREVGVDDEDAGPVAGRDDARGDRVEVVGGDAVARGDDAAELRLRHLVDLADARAGQDVVELVAEEHPPLRLERRGQRLAEQRRHARQGLGGDQRPLGPAVEELGAALRRQRAAVELEIDLADPDRQRRVLVHARRGPRRTSRRR